MHSSFKNKSPELLGPNPPPRRESRKPPSNVDLAAAKLDAHMDMMMRELAIECQDAANLSYNSTPVTPLSSDSRLPRSQIPSFHSFNQFRSSQVSEGDSAVGNSVVYSPLALHHQYREDNLHYSALKLEDQGAAGNYFLAQMLGDLHVSYSSDEDDKIHISTHSKPQETNISASNLRQGQASSQLTLHSHNLNSSHDVKVRNRAKAVHEIVNTETTYVEMLSTLVELVIRPLRQVIAGNTTTQKKLGFTNDDVNVIFGNIQEILGLHSALLSGLRERYSLWTDDTKISDLFMTVLPFLKMYQLYMSMYAHAIGTLARCRKHSSHMAKIIASAEDNPRFKGLKILSFLILPIQRIPRYILLLENLSKFTPFSHPDYHDLDKSVKEVKRIVQTVNEAIRGFESQRRAIHIHSHLSGRPDSLSNLVAPARKFLSESTDFYFSSSRNSGQDGFGLKSRMLGSGIKYAAIFLFNDLFIVAKRSNNAAGPSERDIWSWRDEVPLLWASLGDVDDASGSKGYILQVIGPEKTITLYTIDRRTRDEWKSKLSVAIEAISKGRPLSLSNRGSSEVSDMMELPGMSAYYSPSFTKGFAYASSIPSGTSAPSSDSASMRDSHNRPDG